MSKIKDLLKADPKDFLKILRAKPATASPEEVAAAEKEKKFVPSLPRVNVLPESVKDRYALNQLIRKFVTAAVLIAVATGGLYGYGKFLDVGHQAAVKVIDEASAKLQLQATSLQQYELYKTSIATKRTTLAGAVQNDVDVAKILNYLNGFATKNSIGFKSIALTLSDGKSGATSCVSPDPFNVVPTIGCLSISGESSGRASTNAFFTGVGVTPGFTNGFISAVTNASGGKPSTFTGTVSITSAFYSGKYSNLGTPIDQALAVAKATAQQSSNKPGAALPPGFGGPQGNNAAPKDTTPLKAALGKYFVGSDPEIETMSSTYCFALSSNKEKAKAVVSSIIKDAAKNKIVLTDAEATQALKLMVTTYCPVNSSKISTLKG